LSALTPAASTGALVYERLAARRGAWTGVLRDTLYARLVALCVASAIVSIAYVTQYPLVLGRWEDQTTFPMMFSASGPRLSFELDQSGQISGTHYAPLTLGYYTAQILGWSLVALRLPSVIGGLGALVVFGVVAARWYGFWPALLAAAALAFNPTFFMFSHQLIVPIVSVLFVLLVIERYQLIEQSKHLLWTVPTLAIAFTLLLQQYAVGRLYGCSIVAFWIVWVVASNVQAWRNHLPVNRRGLLALFGFVTLVVLSLEMLDSRNLQHLTFQLVFPPDGEYSIAGSQLAVVRDNLAVELNAIVPVVALAPDRFGQFSSDLVVDIRAHVLPASMLALVVLGACVAVAGLRRHSSARLTLFLLAVMFVAPLFSANVSGHLSLSTFRMFYLVIPLYLLAAAAAAWLVGHRARVIRLAGGAALALVVAAQVGSAVTEINRSNLFLDDLAHRWDPSSKLTLFRDNGVARTTPRFELMTNGSYQYYFLQLAPLAAAVRILDRAPVGGTDQDVVLVRLVGAVQPGDAYGPTRLVFYLRSLGASAALFDPTTSTMRGAGPLQPRYVVTDNPASAASAASLLSATGRTVRVVDFQWSP
jgi:hypothetical protein